MLGKQLLSNIELETLEEILKASGNDKKFDVLGANGVFKIHDIEANETMSLPVGLGVLAPVIKDNCKDSESTKVMSELFKRMGVK